MTDDRPNPDEVLARVQSAEAKASRGQLTVFLGYAPGVGKTYTMLQAAHRERAEGVDVAVGYIEPHARPETLALLEGLESLPPKVVPHQTIDLKDFDLDAALARRPRLILVDELAHTNAPGLRHAKRWQDIDDLLAAGVDVYTTLNVQHVESLNDVVAQITGVRVRETLPDSVLELADEFELIDLPPHELLQRLREGKVYVPAQAERAVQHFFTPGNLVALRELALRRMADHVDKQVRSARLAGSARRTWPTAERLLVCYGGSPASAKVIRAAKRLAAALRAEWIAVHVETAATEQMDTSARRRLFEHQRLAERLGAETATLASEDVTAEIFRYARARNVTKIVVGKTAQPRWKLLVRGSIVDELLRHGSDIDVYVIHGGEPAVARREPGPRAIHWRRYGITTLVVGACTLVAWAMSALGLTEANLVMVYLLGVVLTAARYGRGPGVFASVVSVLLFDFCFVPPYGTFAVADAEYFITFGVMLAIALTTSALMARIRSQAEAARQRSQRSEALHRLSRQLAAASGTQFLVAMAGKQLGDMFGGEVVIYLPDEVRSLALWLGQGTSVARDPKSQAVAHWVFEHDRLAGLGTDTLPDAAALFVPLTGSQATVGVLGICPREVGWLLEPEQRHMLDACASLIALAIERDQIALDAQKSLVQVEAEQLRSSLLSSVSHDLRTPLATITGAATSLMAADGPDEATRRELLASISDEAHRLSRLVENLLQMTRFEAGGVQVTRQWCPIEEVVGSALRRAGRLLAGRPLRTDLPADLPLVAIDDVLIEQVLLNLLENAGRYTPAGTPIEVHVRTRPQALLVEVADRGAGLPPGEERRIFDKFHRGAGVVRDRRGAGLGLTICRAIVEAHGGRIDAENRPDGGAVFRFTLPLGEPPTAAEAVRPAEAGCS